MAIGVPSSWIDVLSGYFGQAAARMREDLFHPQGKTVYTQSWNASWSAQKLQQHIKMLEQLDQIAAREIGRGMSRAISTGVRQANAQLAAAGVLARKNAMMGSFGLTDTRQIELLAKDAAIHLQAATRSMRKVSETILRATQQYKLGEPEIRKVVAGGLLDGMPEHGRIQLKSAFDRVALHEVVDQKTGEVHKVDGLIEVNGRHYDTRYYSRMVYDTTASEAHVKATHQRFEEQGVDLVRIIGNRTKYFCTEYLGRIYSLSGKSTKYPALSSLPRNGPPFHPNCSKSTIAFIEDVND